MYSTREISRNQLNHFRNYLSLTSLKKIIWVFLPQGIDFQMFQDDEHLTHTHTHTHKKQIFFLLLINRYLCSRFPSMDITLAYYHDLFQMSQDDEHTKSKLLLLLVLCYRFLSMAGLYTCFFTRPFSGLVLYTTGPLNTCSKVIFLIYLYHSFCFQIRSK